uniref:Transposase n=1 Tax=Ascaris lumbricoides TaxID=6252 RepID=A0A0M3IH06_ASCLU
MQRNAVILTQHAYQVEPSRYTHRSFMKRLSHNAYNRTDAITRMLSHKMLHVIGRQSAIQLTPPITIPKGTSTYLYRTTSMESPFTRM